MREFTLRHSKCSVDSEFSGQRIGTINGARTKTLAEVSTKPIIVKIMRDDIKINILIIAVVLATFFISISIVRYNFNKGAEKFFAVKSELEFISMKIEKFYFLNNRFPKSLDENDFTLYINGISILDPYDPGGMNYRYIKMGKKFKIYSVGSNGVDDGGITHEKGNTIILDIVVEGRIIKPLKIRAQCPSQLLNSA